MRDENSTNVLHAPGSTIVSAHAIRSIAVVPVESLDLGTAQDMAFHVLAQGRNLQSPTFVTTVYNRR